MTGSASLAGLVFLPLLAGTLAAVLPARAGRALVLGSLLGLPLLLLAVILRELRGQSHGQVGRDERAPSCERRADRLTKERALEFELPGQHPQIEKVLHAAVDDTQHDHRLELFGHNGFSRVCRQCRGWKIE